MGILKTYRNLFKEVPNLAATYGSIQCVIGGVVLAKLGKYIYNTNVHLQRECILMGSELFSAPFKISMFHPHNKIDFIEYRMKEFLPDTELLSDKQVILPIDLLSGLDIMCEMLLDYGLYERILPCATLMNYVATDVVKTIPYMVKAKVLKGIALCNLGYISQSLTCFYQIIEDKDQVINVINPSEYLRQSKGSSFSFKDPVYSYRNDLPPEAEENVQSIEHLIEVEPKLCESLNISPLLESLVVFLKNAIILATLKDPFDISETEDMRNKYFSTAEEGFKKAIECITNEEEVVKLKTKIQFIQQKASQNPRTGKYMEFCERKLNKLLDIDPEEEKSEDAIPKSKYDNLDEGLPHSFRRSSRLSWIIRCKLALSSLYKKRGNLLDSFYISRQNLFEISNMAMPIGISNQIDAQFTDEKFEIPDGATSAATGKKGGKEDKKADPKKDKGKGKDESDEFEDEDKMFEQEEERIWSEINPSKPEKSELP